ncbi:MAG: hypothetical protein RQ743_13315, partial [Bacteroidales bacterium]|nr:hypothetical protein [Bacteroidales bacterium]
PPSSLILPPETADEYVMDVAAVVVTVGSTGSCSFSQEKKKMVPHISRTVIEENPGSCFIFFVSG